MTETRQPTCVIELCAPQPGYKGYTDVQVKQFLILCQTEATMRKAFVRAEGRTFYFVFPSQLETSLFLQESSSRFSAQHVEWKREQFIYHGNQRTVSPKRRTRGTAVVSQKSRPSRSSVLLV